MYITVKTIINHANVTICKLYYPCQFSCHMSLSFFLRAVYWQGYKLLVKFHFC